MKFIGHLDIMRYFQKAIRRADIDVAYSEGFSPHMIMSFASPLGIGLSSDGEYFDIELTAPISSSEAVKRMNEACVEGIEVLSFRQISEEKKMTGMTILAAADYLVRPRQRSGLLPEDWTSRFEAFLAQPEIRIVKQTKRSEKEVDIRPMIYNWSVRDDAVYLQLAAGSAQNLKPDLVMDAFCRYLDSDTDTSEASAGPEDFSYHRLEMYADAGTDTEKKLVTLESLGTEIA